LVPRSLAIRWKALREANDNLKNDFLLHAFNFAFRTSCKQLILVTAHMMTNLASHEKEPQPVNLGEALRNIHCLV